MKNEQRANRANEEVRPPSGAAIEASVSAYQRLKAEYAADAALDLDEDVIAFELANANVADPRDLLARIIDATVWAERRAQEAKALKNEYHERQQRYEVRSDDLRLLAQRFLNALELRHHRGRIGKARLQAAPDSVVVLDLEQLERVYGEKYVKIEKQARKRELSADLRNGETIDGAVLSNGGVMLVVTKV